MDIKGTIKKHGFTLEKVANEMGISKGSFSTATKGNPTIKTLRKIANVLGCSVTEFFEDETNVQSSTFVCPRCGAPLHISVKEEKHESKE